MKGFQACNLVVCSSMKEQVSNKYYFLPTFSNALLGFPKLITQKQHKLRQPVGNNLVH